MSDTTSTATRGPLPTREQLAAATDLADLARSTGYSVHQLGELRAAWAEEDAARAAQPARPACPPWCRYPAGHEYDTTDEGGAYRRYHSSAPGRDAEVELIEVNRDGQVTFPDGPQLVGWVGGTRSERTLTAEQARRAAADLLAAADSLDALHAGEGGEELS